MSAAVQIPEWLKITKVGEQHYQVTDTSMESIGLCLGAFHSRQAAQNFANKIAMLRSQARTNNSRGTLSLRQSPAPPLHLQPTANHAGL